jgi:hypothetical protein
MNVTKMAMAGALGFATVISAASIASGYPHQQMPTLLMLNFFVIPTTSTCYDGACQSPLDSNPGEPASVRAESVAIGPAP